MRSTETVAGWARKYLWFYERHKHKDFNGIEIILMGFYSIVFGNSVVAGAASGAAVLGTHGRPSYKNRT